MPDEAVTQDNNEQKEAPVWLRAKQDDLDYRMSVRKEYEQLFTVWKQEELAALDAKNTQIINEGLTKYFNEWKEQQKPPTQENIQKLLDQEYMTFTIKVDYLDDNGAETSEMFTLRELPQAAEKRFYTQFKDRVLKNTQALQAFAQEGIDMPFEQKAKSVMSLFDESFDILADTVVICLNPFGKKPHVNREWVQNNMSSNRIWSIIEAQIQVNKLKDFFSRISQSGQMTQSMMSGLSIQQLRQYAQ